MKILSKLLLTFFCFTPLISVASDGDVTFTGLVSASACTLKGFNGGTGTTALIQLPNVTPSSFTSAGGYAGMTDFTINLQNCDITTMKNARVAFSGTPDTVDNAILKNLHTPAPATGVGVAVLENDGTSLVDINGGVASRSQALTTGDTALKFKVAYKANTTTPAVTAGPVMAKTYVDITYN